MLKLKKALLFFLIVKNKHIDIVFVLSIAACYSVHVRGSEYIPLIGSNEASCALLGVPPEIDY